MPVFSSNAFKNNYNYNQLAKKEAKIINEQFEKENYEFVMNLMFGKNKFKADGVEYEFKAFKFNAGKTNTGVRENAAQLLSNLKEVDRLIPLNIDKIEEIAFNGVAYNGTYANLDSREMTGEYWTKKQVEEEVAKEFPSTPQDALKIRIHDNTEAKNEKMQDRKSVDVSTVSSVEQLRTAMYVHYLSEFNKESQDAYRAYLDATKNGKAQTTNPDYVKGLDVAEKMGVDNDFVDKAITVIKNKQDEYKAMSGAGRFFSYINPFPNKYRTARNNVANMINELSSNTDITKEDLSNYVYGKSTEKPQIDVPAYEEVAEQNLTAKNDLLNKQLEELGDNNNSVSLEENLNKDFALDMGEKEQFLEEDNSSVRSREDKIDL